MKTLILRSSILAVALGSVSTLAWADPLDIHRNDGVQIVFNQDLKSDFNEPGDHFTAHVVKDPELPSGTVFTGLVRRVHPATRYRAASMDLVLTSMRLPKGATFAIDAVPTPANDPHLVRGADGRIIAAYKPGEDGIYAVGGTVGGLILGGIGHRPIEGAFIGGLIGSIAGAFDRRDNANLVVRKGEKMVAVFNEDVAFTSAKPSGWRTREGYGQPVGSLPPTPAPPTSSSPSSYPDVRVNGVPVKFAANPPYRQGNTVMVPLEYTATQLNLIATVHDDGSITLDGPDSSIQLHVNSASCQAPGNSAPLSLPVQNHSGVIYAPVGLFARILGDPITVDGTVVN